jgi:hypothetical protein
MLKSETVLRGTNRGAMQRLPVESSLTGAQDRSSHIRSSWNNSGSSTHALPSLRQAPGINLIFLGFLAVTVATVVIFSAIRSKPPDPS